MEKARKATVLSNGLVLYGNETIKVDTKKDSNWKEHYICKIIEISEDDILIYCEDADCPYDENIMFKDIENISIVEI